MFEILSSNFNSTSWIVDQTEDRKSALLKKQEVIDSLDHLDNWRVWIIENE